MKIASPAVDYRKLRWNNLFSAPFSHLKLLLFWPVFGALFLLVERFYPVGQYYVMHHPLDDVIPFCEWFLLPYLFWFVFLVGIHLYTLLYDVAAFRKLMHFIILTYGITLAIYFIFPTCQQLRPLVFERDNPLTRFIAAFYRFDTNTNVCPSLHVVGSFAVMFTAWQSRGLQSRAWKAAFAVTAILISISTVFMKQHSLWDVIAALPICLLGYGLCFWRHAKNP